MPEPDPTTPLEHAHRPVVRVANLQIGGQEADSVAVEEPMEIRVRSQAVAITMRTPGHDQELACGFLVSEGVIRMPEDLVQIAHCLQVDESARGNILNVFLGPSASFDPARLTRHVFGSSSCGICGKATIESIQRDFQPAASGPEVGVSQLAALPALLQGAQPSFIATGGLHAAGLFTADGRLLASREDVGRHNAVDKVIGWAFLAGMLPLRGAILLVSGRASFEIMQKALAAGIPIVAAVSAPSSLAVDFALAGNQTLVGFLRGARFNIYSHPERITA